MIVYDITLGIITGIILIKSIILILFFPWLVAYFYRKMNYIPWSVWEKNPNTKIYNTNTACESDYKRKAKPCG